VNPEKDKADLTVQVNLRKSINHLPVGNEIYCTIGSYL